MKSQLLTLSLLTMALLQVACSEDGKQLTQAEICVQHPTPACTRALNTPENVKALAGAAAINGEKQVATLLPGETAVKPGQVNAAIPASVVEERSRQVTATMKAIEADPDFHLTNGTHTLIPTSAIPAGPIGGGSSAGEITVAHLPETQVEARAPAQASITPASVDPNSVFSQPEATGAGGAH